MSDQQYFNNAMDGGIPAYWEQRRRTMSWVVAVFIILLLLILLAMIV